MKLWKHKGTLKPTTTKWHLARPYARIGTNRCAICGDEIELVEYEHEEPKIENPYRKRSVRYILNKYLKRKKPYDATLEEILTELSDNQTSSRIEMELHVIIESNWPKPAPEPMRELAIKLLTELKESKQ